MSLYKAQDCTAGEHTLLSQGVAGRRSISVCNRTGVDTQVFLRRTVKDGFGPAEIKL